LIGKASVAFYILTSYVSNNPVYIFFDQKDIIICDCLGYPMRLLRFIRAVTLAFGNHVVSLVPSFLFRHAYYCHILRYNLDRKTSVHMGCFFTGGNIEIGPNTIVNRRCTLDGRMGLKIGANCSISPEVQLLTMTHDPQDPDFAVCGGATVIEDHVWIGTRALILPGVTVGEGAVIGAGSVVTKNIAPWRIAVGNPAKEIKDRNRNIRYQCEYRTWFDTDIAVWSRN
jgi:acetyltransferase-like isoleucine patch superfamily enzyme